MDISEVKSQFPIFSKKINGKQLVYLDSSNSAQKPASVIKKLDNFYKNEFSNIGRSIHALSVNATNKFEETRSNVKKFINANSKDGTLHPKGVWTLPPSLRLGEEDRAKYLAIGESDRMTLKFMKPI